MKMDKKAALSMAKKLRRRIFNYDTHAELDAYSIACKVLGPDASQRLPMIIDVLEVLGAEDGT